MATIPVENSSREPIFETPFGKSEQFASVLFVICVLLVAFGLQVAEHEGILDGPYIPYIGLGIMLCVGCVWITTPRRYRFGDGGLTIEGLLLKTTIPYSGIVGIEVLDESEMDIRSTFAIPRQLFPHVNRYSSKRYGKLDVRSNRLFPAVIIPTKLKTYLLSPDETPGFIAELRIRVDSLRSR